MSRHPSSLKSYCGTSKETGKAAKEAESSNNSLYIDLVTEYEFIPVAMETLGSWEPSRLKVITEIGARIALATGEKKSKYYLFQANFMAVQRGNVISVS